MQTPRRRGCLNAQKEPPPPPLDSPRLNIGVWWKLGSSRGTRLRGSCPRRPRWVSSRETRKVAKKMVALIGKRERRPVGLPVSRSLFTQLVEQTEALASRVDGAFASFRKLGARPCCISAAPLTRETTHRTRFKRYRMYVRVSELFVKRLNPYEFITNER